MGFWTIFEYTNYQLNSLFENITSMWTEHFFQFVVSYWKIVQNKQKNVKRFVVSMTQTKSKHMIHSTSVCRIIISVWYLCATKMTPSIYVSNDRETFVILTRTNRNM